MALSFLAPACAHAQDFAAPAPPGPSTGPLAFLDSALPPALASFGIEAGQVSWFGVPGLGTRVAAAGLGAGAARIALGLSQTGEPDIGWNTLALVAGTGGVSGGASLRAALRRDRTPVPGSALGPGMGLEVGGGAWVEAGRSARMWADAPQLWLRLRRCAVSRSAGRSGAGVCGPPWRGAPRRSRVARRDRSGWA